MRVLEPERMAEFVDDRHPVIVPGFRRLAGGSEEDIARLGLGAGIVAIGSPRVGGVGEGDPALAAAAGEEVDAEAGEALDGQGMARPRTLEGEARRRRLRAAERGKVGQRLDMAGA